MNYSEYIAVMLKTTCFLSRSTEDRVLRTIYFFLKTYPNGAPLGMLSNRVRYFANGKPTRDALNRLLTLGYIEGIVQGRTTVYKPTAHGVDHLLRIVIGEEHAQ